MSTTSSSSSCEYYEGLYSSTFFNTVNKICHRNATELSDYVVFLNKKLELYQSELVTVGSVMHGTPTSQSDVDVYVRGRLNIHQLYGIFDKNCEYFDVKNIIFISPAKVPIIRLESMTGITVDISNATDGKYAKVVGNFFKNTGCYEGMKYFFGGLSWSVIVIWALQKIEIVPVFNSFPNAINASRSQESRYWMKEKSSETQN